MKTSLLNPITFVASILHLDADFNLDFHFEEILIVEIIVVSMIETYILGQGCDQSLLVDMSPESLEGTSSDMRKDIYDGPTVFCSPFLVFGIHH